MKTKQNIIINGHEYVQRKSVYTRGISPVHINDHMTGKLENIPCISTACTANPICLKRMESGEAVCAHCFADATLNMRKELREACEMNFKLLTGSVLPEELLPEFRNVSIVRIESFGDVYNETQVINYLNIIKKSPRVTFAAWTKNAWLWNAVLDKVGKPENLSLVYSSYKLNTPARPEEYVSRATGKNYFDHVFTVYDKEHQNMHGPINCGARDCESCRKCYEHSDGHFAIFTFIRELLK